MEESKIFEKVKGLPGECWLWRGTIRKDGYAQAQIKGKFYVLHRLVYLRQIGNIPNGRHVLHSCGNLSCLNPGHLFLGNNQAKREKHKRWKGGKYINANGYIMVQAKDHPHANRYGYILEHRLIAEKELGRFLLTNETVHHINKCKTDNSPENLEVLLNKVHTSYHSKGKNNPRYLPTEYITAELQRVSKLNNGPLSYKTFCEQSNLASGACRGRFGSWNNAKKEAYIL